jgi:Kef-type K+ transport system membrane component KefB/CBS domain-containing protein
LAFALLASLAFGRGAARLGIPRVTVYVLVGLALGPHGLLRLFEPGDPGARLLLGPLSEAPLRATAQLALGFILFGIGAEFRFETMRRLGPPAVALSGIEIAVTGLLVGAAVWLGTGSWQLGVVAPALAVASAPSATLVTLREVEAEGPASRLLILCVGHNNLAALILFPLLAAAAFGGQALGSVAWVLLAPLLGGAVGLFAAVWIESIDGRRELVLAGILVVLATLGLLDWARPGATGIGMLGCFGAGLALANASPHAERLQRYMENTVYPLYVLFFIDAGRDLHVEALATAGLLGVLFVAARAAGKVLGVQLGLNLVRFEEEIPRGLGAGLLCQAGIALGLVSALETLAPQATLELRHVVVASVVVFELLGPWLVRRTAVAAGEVKLANLLPHPEATGAEALRWVAHELRRNLGLADGSELERGSEGPTVETVMRRRPASIAEALPFQAVLKVLAETHADLLPVVDAAGRFKGVVSYDEVKHVLYDPALRDIVIAGDLTTPVDDPLAPDTPLAEALESLDRRGVHSWPVVKEGRLAGVVRRSDAYALVRRGLSGRRGRR